MTTRSVSPLESDPPLLSVLTIYGVHSPVGTIRAALAAGHSEQSLRARVAWLRSQLVEVPFSERGSVTVENAPSWKTPYAPQKVHACLSKPENVAGAANLGWGSVDAVWKSYADEASELIEPALGIMSPKRWHYADGEKGRKNYAPMGAAGERPKTAKRPRAEGLEPRASSPVPVDQPSTINHQPSDLAAVLSTPEGRERLAGLVAQLPGGSRLRPQILAGELTTAGKMACRSALMMEAGK